MKFCEFEKIMSSKRMRRYVNACGGDTRKGMRLYRMNLNLASLNISKDWIFLNSSSVLGWMVS